MNANKKKVEKEDQLVVIIGKNQNNVYAKKESDLARHLGV